MMHEFGNELIELMKKYSIIEIRPKDMDAVIKSEGEGLMYGFIIVGSEE